MNWANAVVYPDDGTEESVRSVRGRFHILSPSVPVLACSPANYGSELLGHEIIH